MNKEEIDKIKKCLIAGYDLDIITQEEMSILWNYITNLQEKKIPEKLPKSVTDNACSSKDMRLIAIKLNEIIDYLDYLKSKGDE